MKFFVDTANLEAIKECRDMGVLDGVTTNPTLIAKEGKEHHEAIKEICAAVAGPVSAEVLATDTAGMLEEARVLARIADNVVVKIPLIKDGIKAVKTLSTEGIQTNVTLCFNATQALIAARAGAGFISPFLGRLDDIGHEGMDLIQEIRVIYDNYGLDTQVLAASIRHPLHVRDAAMVGADVVTIPPDIFGKLLSHPLTDLGLEKFLADAQKGA